MVLNSSGGNKTDGVPFPNENYYDYYETTDRNTACNGGKCIGQNTNEATGWYGDYSNFVSTSYPWLYRGGYNASSKSAGVFSVYYSAGNASISNSFRVIITQN